MTGSGECTAVPERSMREKQTVAWVAWLFLWDLRHAAKAKWSAQRELHILREKLRQENDMLMLSAGSAFDLSRRLGERENEIQVFLCCFLCMGGGRRERTQIKSVFKNLSWYPEFWTVWEESDDEKYTGWRSDTKHLPLRKRQICDLACRWGPLQ